MKYVRTKNGDVYLVIHENEGFDKSRYLCEANDSHDIVLESDGETHVFKDCRGIIFLDKGEVAEEIVEEEEAI